MPASTVHDDSTGNENGNGRCVGRVLCGNSRVLTKTRYRVLRAVGARHGWELSRPCPAPPRLAPVNHVWSKTRTRARQTLFPVLGVLSGTTGFLAIPLLHRRRVAHSIEIGLIFLAPVSTNAARVLGVATLAVITAALTVPKPFARQSQLTPGNIFRG